MIISFYSYKGGVGRTQLVANLAGYLCYYQAKKILLIDWDLEAPGLHFYFGKGNDYIQKKGLIDLFLEYEAQSTSEKGLDHNHLPKFDQDHITPLIQSHTQGGRVDIIPAGNYTGNYQDQIHQFDWEAFYENHDGKIYIEYLKQELKKMDYDYIFIDSRTGFSDYSGICNIQMPDVNVVLVAPTEQNFMGALRVVHNIRNSPYVCKAGIRKPIIFPILSRLELSLEHEADKWIRKFRDAFGFLIKPLSEMYFEKDIDETRYFEHTLLDYKMDLAFGENMLFVEDRKELVEGTLAEKYENIAKYLEKEIGYQNGKNKAENYYNIGTSHFAIEEYEKAIKYFRKAVEEKEDFRKAWFHLGLVYEKMNDVDQALTAFQSLIKINPDERDAWFKLGTAHVKKERYGEAIEAFQRLTELDPKDDRGWNNLGNTYLRVEAYQQAILSCKKALEINPNNYTAWYNLGIAYYNTSNFPGSIQAFEEAINRGAIFQEAWIYLSHAYAKKGQYRRAIKVLKDGIERNPQNGFSDSIYYNLASLHSLEKRKTEALEYLERAVRLNPQFKTRSRQEEEFEWLWQDMDFIRLTAE